MFGYIGKPFTESFEGLFHGTAAELRAMGCTELITDREYRRRMGGGRPAAAMLRNSKRWAAERKASQLAKEQA